MPTKEEASMNPVRKIVIGGAIVGAGLIGVAVGAATLGTASAATDPPSTSTPASTPSSSDAPAPPDTTTAKGPHQANGVTESPLAGDDAAKATAAAQAAVPGATVDRVETDADGA